VLLLTIHEDETMLKEGIRAGARGYILKRAVESELTNAIRAVARGEFYVHPAMTRALLEVPPPTVIVHNRQATLTQRELEILRLIATGHTNRQIAENLDLSIRTVETHRGNLMSKLDLHSRVELVRYAMEQNLINDG
jgi:DNA-binding NarL/FixJ family response regulator